jgi:hypothetical protein
MHMKCTPPKILWRRVHPLDRGVLSVGRQRRAFFFLRMREEAFDAASARMQLILFKYMLG